MIRYIQSDLRSHRLLAFLPYLILLITCYWVFSETVDDPYITFRYAANLVAGHGPVYNIGEPVEGFTSPLHLLTSALLLNVASSGDILFKAKILSLVFSLILIYQSGKLAERFGLSRWECLVVQILLALNVNFAIAAVNGLETTMYACLVVITTSTFVREGHTESGYASAGWLFLSLLARPDAILIFIALFFVQLLRIKRGQATVRIVTKWIVLFIVPVLILTTARWFFYHSLLPNTYYAKHVSFIFGLKQGLQYLTRTLSPDIVGIHTGLRLHASWQERLLLFNMLLFWGLAILGMTKVAQKDDATIFAVEFLALLILVLRTGGDWMLGWRFVIAFLPLLAILQCRGIRRLAFLFGQQYLKTGAPKHNVQQLFRHASFFCVVFFWTLAFLFAPHYSWASARFSTQGKDLLIASSGLGPNWVATGDYIHESLPAGSYIAYTEMGYAGFVNLDKKFLDLRGLTEPKIARLPSSFKALWGVSDPYWYLPQDSIAQILLQRKPDFIICGSNMKTPTILRDQYYIANRDGLLLIPFLQRKPVYLTMYLHRRQSFVQARQATNPRE